MKKYINDSIFQINPKNYLKLIIIIVPILNFLPGFTFDLYTPSMPALAHYFLTSITIVKNTVTATLIGFSIGGIISGVLLDVFGRRRIILLGLLLYVIASITAIFCHSIHQLLAVRFIQGFLAACFTIGCRAIIIDQLKGHQFNVAMLYVSLAYGMGPIIGPFIGGILQHHFGWKANFIAYAVIAFLFLCLYALLVSESMPKQDKFSFKRLYSTYRKLLMHRVFIVSILIVGCCQIQLLLFSTVGAFIVENILHKTAIIFGNSALLIGCSYFLGNLTNRLLIKKYHVHYLAHLGVFLLLFASIVQLAVSHFAKLNLYSLVAPIMMIGYSLGIIFPTLSLRALKIFPQYAGMATSVLIAFGLALSSAGMFIISFIDVDDLMRLSLIFSTVTVLQMILFYGLIKREDVID